MYINTEKLNKILDQVMPGVDETTRIRLIFKKIGMRNIPLNRMKFLSNEIIVIGNNTGERLFNYLVDLTARKNINIKIYDVIFPFNRTGKPVFDRYMAEDKLKEQRLNDVKIQNDTAVQNDTTIQNDNRLQNEFYSSMIKQLREMNENLEIISKTQTETCNFIKTLIFALNGDTKNAA